MGQSFLSRIGRAEGPKARVRGFSHGPPQVQGGQETGRPGPPGVNFTFNGASS